MKNLVLIAAAAIMMNVIACKKSVEDVVLPTGYISYLDSALISINPKFTEIVNDSLFKKHWLRLPSGTRMVMQPKIFLNKNNYVDSVGKVSLFVKEIITKSDMMVSGILPVLNGIPVETGRQLMTYAKDNDGLVRIANNKQIQYYVQKSPVPSAAGFGVYYGGTNKFATFLNWYSGGPFSSNSVSKLNDSLIINTDSLGWTTASKAIINPNYVTFKVNIVGPTPTKDKLQIRRYVSYDNYETVTLSESPITQNTYVATAMNAKATHIVVYYIVEGKFYGGIAYITPSQDGFYSVNVSEQSPLGFFSQVKLLP